MMITEFEYTLIKPLENVGVNGQFVTVDRLILRAPSKKLSSYTARLKQGIRQSEAFIQNQLLSSIKDLDAFLLKMQEIETNKPDESDEIKAEKILIQVSRSNINLHEFEESFKQLCINGCCSIDVKTPMTSVLFENLSDKDGDTMLGLYLAKFFL